MARYNFFAGQKISLEKKFFALSDEIGHQEAINRVTEQIFKLNPNANNKAIVKFLGISKKIKNVKHIDFNVCEKGSRRNSK